MIQGWPWPTLRQGQICFLMHLNGNFFWKVDFLNTIDAKDIILTWYVKPNETMAINKFQRSRLTFELSAKVAHIGVGSTY